MFGFIASTITVYDFSVALLPTESTAFIATVHVPLLPAAGIVSAYPIVESFVCVNVR